MASPIWINRGAQYYFININEIEKKYSAKYVGDFCIKTKYDTWSEQPVSVFWVEQPSDPSYSNYFGIYTVNGVIFITNALSATEGYWDGIVADDGEIIYSRYRHDFRQSNDKTVIVDGGRDYFKCMGKVKNPKVRISIFRDQLCVNDTLFFPYENPIK